MAWREAFLLGLCGQEGPRARRACSPQPARLPGPGGGAGLLAPRPPPPPRHSALPGPRCQEEAPEPRPVRPGSSIRRTQSRRARSGRPSVCLSRHYCGPQLPLLTQPGGEVLLAIHQGRVRRRGCKQGEARAPIWSRRGEPSPRDSAPDNALWLPAALSSRPAGEQQRLSGPLITGAEGRMGIPRQRHRRPFRATRCGRARALGSKGTPLPSGEGTRPVATWKRSDRAAAAPAFIARNDSQLEARSGLPRSFLSLLAPLCCPLRFAPG